MLVMLMTAIRYAERAFLAVSLIAMSLMFFVNVAVRGTSPELATELAWIEEATLFALAWLVFIGLGLALERRRQIAMTVLEQRLPRPVVRVVQKLINLTGLVFCIFLAKIGFDLAKFVYQSGQISPTLGVSMAVLYSALPVGFVLLGFRYLLELLGIQDRTTITSVTID